ncbi:MAG: aspartate aminotransferase family protein, partial [Dehalococcoidia bacterium]|nr:aspartate aminotransferase family protein [Dehalococcoidia bacterium]
MPIPNEKDPVALRQAVLDHMHVGMTNHTILAEEGGPLLMESAEGIYITDVEGNKFIDGISGMYFRNAGHGREEIAKAIYDQLTNI